MEIEINEKDLELINSFVNNKLVKVMNEEGLQFAQMAFILDSLINSIQQASVFFLEK